VKSVPEPSFFETPTDLRAWLDANHGSAIELWVGLHKKATGRPSITWPELVDELICFGWIDGLRRSIDADSWMIRITPRRSKSSWSDRNRRRFAELATEGRVRPSGRAAFELWQGSVAAECEPGDASYGPVPGVTDLEAEFERRFRGNALAWEYFRSESAAYRRTVSRWVRSAKKAETRARRLERLIEDSAAGRRIREMRR
jgi:uncharacterized protein YdeI (YjbR/CyaY-like superfamily)